jgi:hypothetical protein
MGYLTQLPARVRPLRNVFVSVQAIREDMGSTRAGWRQVPGVLLACQRAPQCRSLDGALKWEHPSRTSYIGLD